MDLANNAAINIYSIAILVIIFFHSTKKHEKASLQNILYVMILQITILLLAMDIFSRFDGKPDTIFEFINHFGNFAVFLLNPVLPSLWLLYVYDQVYREDGKTRRLIFPLLAVNLVNVIMLVLTQFYGWYYYIGSDNIYHRGSLFILPVSITFTLAFIAFVLIAANRRKIEKRYFFSLLFFAVPPLGGIILQVVFYGHALILNFVVLSLLIVFLDIQNQSLYTDFLTQVGNRKGLDLYMKEKISASNGDKTFSAILTDIDNFKSINDTFGHNVGDNALQAFAMLLNSCLRPDDFISRFGGDEFYIILDISDRTELEAVVHRINKCIDEFNVSGDQPYKLGFSIGYAVYDCNSKMNADEFQKQIDVLMYENKQMKKLRSEQESIKIL